MKPSLANAPAYRHCPGCRRIRPAKNLGRAVVRGEHLDVFECQEPACSLRWCLSARTVAKAAA